MIDVLKRVGVWLIIVSMGADIAWGQSGSGQGKLGPGFRGSQVRRGNPFASILKKNRQNTEEMVRRLEASTRGDTAPPAELFLETIELRYISAEDASEAFACLSSPAGRMRPQKGSNTLVVFDTSDNLKRIVAEIEKADRPVKTLTVKAIGLNYLDAQKAAEVLLKIASQNGHIVIVPKSNTIIICDVLSHVEAMVAELVKLDQPTAGLIVEPILLTHIDAKSAQEALVNLLSEFGTISVVERTNSLVVCDLVKNVNLILDEVVKIDRETAGLIIETVNLRFLDAENLVPILTKMVTQYGSVQANQETNTLIVSDTQESLGQLLAQIRNADKMPRQIMVEVVLMEVQLDDDKEIGINWDMLTEVRSPVGYRQNLTGDGDRLTSIVEDAATLGTATAFNTLGAGGDFSVIVGTVRALVHAIQRKRHVEIIASPRVMVLSGKTATISANEEIPYTENQSFSAGGSFAATQFKNVGVTLEVTATVTEDNAILLEVSTTQSVRTGESSGGVPVVDSRSESTSLLLKDGEIVIMGGLRRQEKTTQRDQIPILGDLPWVGGLFRRTKDIVENMELVILLSPHLYDGSPVPNGVMQRVHQLKKTVPITGAPGPREKPTHSTQAVAR
ncbi:MAG: hypothetical protein IH892_06940 [Planctomycetes bacterium]|nr:hypothetical protein [Planctomycetota bacterium]